MRKMTFLCLGLGAMTLATTLSAQNIAGLWQGTIAANGGWYHQILRISKGSSGWRATYFDIEEAGDSLPVSNVALNDRNLVLTFVANQVTPAGTSYQGALSADGGSLAGTWIEPDGRYPLTFHRVTAKEAWPLPQHAMRFVSVDTNVELEVIDWGGSGPPLVFLAGLGNTAHVFNEFAPKFTNTHHVYGITRRGFGASSTPRPTIANYTADRLGDDVLAVIDSLGLKRPVLIGHSIAGEELSSIGSRYPSKVAGLIYLDAGYQYALYDRSQGDFNLDRRDLAQGLARIQPGNHLRPSEFAAMLHQLRDTILPRFEKDVQEMTRNMDARPRNAPDVPPDTTLDVSQAIMGGEAKYLAMPVPILAIYATPHRRLPPPPGMDTVALARMQAQLDSFTTARATAFEKGVPSARVVRIPNATHYVFESNETDVLREMNAFLARLSQ